MEDAAIYTSLILNFLYAAAFLVAILGRVRTNVITESAAKTIYPVAVLVVGVISGAALFPALVWVYEWAGLPQPLGHGEVLVAALTFNFLLSTVLAVVGRVVLGWRPMQW